MLVFLSIGSNFVRPRLWINRFLLSQEILDSFSNSDFWYVDQGVLAPDADGSASFRKPLQRQEEKWWLPVPRVPPGGLHEAKRKQLQHKRECTNQILKAAMAINSIALADMEVPESYLEALPKVKNSFSIQCFWFYKIKEELISSCCLVSNSEWKGQPRRCYPPVYNIWSVLSRMPSWLPWPFLGTPGFGDHQPCWGLNIHLASKTHDQCEPLNF